MVQNLREVPKNARTIADVFGDDIMLTERFSGETSLPWIHAFLRYADDTI
jgi:hypothetical protein